MIVGIILAVVAGILLLLPEKKASGTLEPTAPPAPNLSCSIQFRGETIQLCKTEEELKSTKMNVFHFWNRFQLHDDDGSFGFWKNVGETLQAPSTVRFFPGTNGNYIILSRNRRLIAYQAKNESRTYPPKKDPSNEDVDETQTLYPVFAELVGETLKGSILASNIVTEWQIVPDDKNTLYFHIQVPDSDTTGTNVKKFTGARLRIAYGQGDGFLSDVSFEGRDNNYYIRACFSAVEGGPNYPTEWLLGNDMDKFTISTTSYFI